MCLIKRFFCDEFLGKTDKVTVYDINTASPICSYNVDSTPVSTIVLDQNLVIFTIKNGIMCLDIRANLPSSLVYQTGLDYDFAYESLTNMCWYKIVVFAILMIGFRFIAVTLAVGRFSIIIECTLIQYIVPLMYLVL